VLQCFITIVHYRILYIIFYFDARRMFLMFENVLIIISVRKINSLIDRLIFFDFF